MATVDETPGVGMGISLRELIATQATACRDYCNLLADLVENRVEMTEFTNKSVDLYISSLTRLATNAVNLGRHCAR